MSTEHSQAQQVRAAADHKRQGQDQQWRDIGISAVAAAARQASELKTNTAATTPSHLGKRIVTLRDIDHVVS